MAATDQIHVREGETPPSTISDGSHRILSEQRDTTYSGAGQRAVNAADSAALVNSSALPDLQIDGHDSHSEGGFMHFLHGAATVVGDLAKGAADELIHHPGEVVSAGLTGLAVGAVALVAAPEIALAAAVVGAGVGAFELATHVGAWMHDADVVSNSGDYSTQEVALAHQNLKNVGGGALLVGAGMIGSLGADPLVGAISDLTGASAASAISSENATVADVIKNAIQSGRYERVSVPGSNGMEVYFRPVQEPLAIGAPAFMAAFEGARDHSHPEDYANNPDMQ